MTSQDSTGPPRKWFDAERYKEWLAVQAVFAIAATAAIVVVVMMASALGKVSNSSPPPPDERLAGVYQDHPDQHKDIRFTTVGFHYRL